MAADAADSALDRLAGYRGAAQYQSSGRFQGRPGFRASRAFDGTPRAWIASWLPGRPAWLDWTLPEAATVSELRLAPARERVRRPTVVRLNRSAPVAVAPDGTVRLPEPVRARTFTLEVLEAAFSPAAPGRVRQRRAVGIGEIEAAGLARADVPRSGPLRARCGALAATLGGEPLRLRPEGTVGDLDAGRPLRVRQCGRPVALPAGPTALSMPAGVFAPHLLRLRAPPPRPQPAPAAPGRVLDTGTPSAGARRGIRVDVPEGGRLILGQAWSAAWRARCDGTELGAPEPVDGFAMSWLLPSGCTDVDLRFGPDRTVRLGYLVSAPVLLAIVLLLALRRPPAGPAADLTPLPAPRTRRIGAGRAAAAALAAGAVLAFVFALRTGPPIALAVFLVLWRGIGPRPLVAVAGALLLVAVPLLAVLVPADDRGGYNPEYPVDKLPVHWVTVAAVVLLALALVRVLSTATARARPRAPAA